MIGRGGPAVGRSTRWVGADVTRTAHTCFHSYAPSALGGAWMRNYPAGGEAARPLARSLSTSKLPSLGSRHSMRDATPHGLPHAAATYNFSPEQSYMLAEALRSRPKNVERGMRAHGIQTIIAKSEQPGETSLQETIARALWNLETARALSDAIVESRR